MNTFRSRLFASLILALLPPLGIIGHVQTAAADQTSDTASSAASTDVDEPEEITWHRHFGWHHHHGNDLVSIGHDTDLPSGQRADSVVSVFGSASSEGDAEAVVSILGDTRVTGSVGDSVVAILGNTYVDSTIEGDAVAVLGNIVLGPHADIGGDVIAIGGTVQRDPAAIVHGNVQVIAHSVGSFAWLRPWVEHCLFYGRPLALVSGIDWAWGLAFAFLALYVALALLFRAGVAECVRTIETQPGMTVVAALLTLLLVPILLALLFITVIGIAALPFVVFALFCADLFGKAVILAWLGRRCVGAPAEGPFSHPAAAVLVGGAIVLVLYLIPILGFVVFKLLGLMGLGVVTYTLILAVRAHRAAKGEGHPGGGLHAAPVSGAPSAGAASVADTADGRDPGSPASSAGGAPRTDSPPRAAAAPPAVTAAAPRAGFWIRMVALLLDALLVGIVMHLFNHLFHAELLVLAIYGAAMWKLRGTTIGGIVFDLQVVRLDGREIDWETAIVRALGCFLSLAVAGLGFFWIAFDDAKQAWHDKIAGTVVVRVRKGVAPS